MHCKSILVVEDDDAIRAVLAETLEMEGYKVYTAANGLEGLDILKNVQHPCLILLDLMMPVMNGWQFLECQRQDDLLATIPVVVVSAAGDRAKALQAPYIKKPIELETLLDTVRKYCGDEEAA